MPGKNNKGGRVARAKHFTESLKAQKLQGMGREGSKMPVKGGGGGGGGTPPQKNKQTMSLA